MQVCRMDLADKGSPEGLVSMILRLEPELPVPVPIKQLCRQLDIEDIVPLETEGFEGGLLTDTARSRGIVLVNDKAPRRRKRFTIGHELGHFLMPSHMPDKEGQFLCSRRDMMRLTVQENDRRAKMEVEANRFASLILMPPPALKSRLSAQPEPSIEGMFRLADDFDVSKEAMARSYADYHPESVSFVIVHEGKVQRVYRNRARFPFITVRRGQPVPQGSLFHRRGHQQSVPSGVDSRVPDLWLDVERGRTAPTLCEQVCLQARGFAIIMLWHERAEDDDEDNDERTAKERFLDRLAH